MNAMYDWHILCEPITGWHLPRFPPRPALKEKAINFIFWTIALSTFSLLAYTVRIYVLHELSTQRTKFWISFYPKKKPCPRFPSNFSVFFPTHTTIELHKGVGWVYFYHPPRTTNSFRKINSINVRKIPRNTYMNPKIYHCK